MVTTIRQLVLIIAVLLVFSRFTEAQAGRSTPQQLLKWGIVGSSSCDSKPCYNTIMSDPAVQQLLLDLAEGPRDRTALEKALQHSEISPTDLLRFGLIRQDGDKYGLNFPLFTARDQRKIQQVTDRYATSLADAILARRPEIETNLLSYDAPGVNRRDVALFVLGCASLDWDGLNITAAKAYRRASVPRPDGVYVPYAEEMSDVSTERIYEGSHNNIQDGIEFTSFGDDAGRARIMLPDLGYSALALPNTVGDNRYPDFYVARKALVSASLNRTITDLGRIMLALRDGQMSSETLSRRLSLSAEDVDRLLKVLVKIEYVSEVDGQYRLNIPVLTKRDEAMTKQLLAIGHDQMESWLAANYSDLKRDLGDLTFVRAGVPYEEGFTMLWHYVFGRANQKLVEAGLFSDPYARKHPGAIPAVTDLDLLK